MTDDRNISVADVQTLTTRDGVVAFFAALSYRTDSRQPQSVSAMGITPGYNIQSLFRILPQHTVARRCAKSLDLPQNGFCEGINNGN